VQSGGIVASFGQSCAITAVNTSGWTSAVWELPDFPPGMACPSGWSTSAGGVYYFQPPNPTTPPPVFNLPASGAQNWGKIPIRLRINNNPLQLTNGAPTPGFVATWTDTATILSLLSPVNQMPGICVTEAGQFDSVRQWVGQIMAALRLIDDAGSVAASGVKLFPYVDLIASIGGVCDGPGFSATTAGVYFSPNVVGSVIVGVRFYWVAPGGGAVDVKCSLWQNAVSLGTGTAVAVPTGINTVMFNSPYTVRAGDLSLPFVVSTYAPGGSGGYYCNVNAAFQTICNSQSNNTVPVAPVLASPLWRYQGGDNTPENVFGLSTTGAEAQPTTKYGQSTYFAIEPIFAT
jgi:hypothetical protein